MLEYGLRYRFRYGLKYEFGHLFKYELWYAFTHDQIHDNFKKFRSFVCLHKENS